MYKPLPSIYFCHQCYKPVVAKVNRCRNFLQRHFTLSQQFQSVFSQETVATHQYHPVMSVTEAEKSLRWRPQFKQAEF
jgi:hypothetical protein